MLDIKKLLEKMLKNMPEIRHGDCVSLGQISANSYKDFSIVFDEPMNGVPMVVCSLYSTATAAAIGSITASAINPTANGFTCRVFNNATSARTPALSYVAFYGGGYCITSIISRLSAIGRWWEHVRCEGFTGEDAFDLARRITRLHSHYGHSERHEDHSDGEDREPVYELLQRVCTDGESEYHTRAAERVSPSDRIYGSSTNRKENSVNTDKRRRGVLRELRRGIYGRDSDICKRDVHPAVISERGCLPC